VAVELSPVPDTAQLAAFVDDQVSVVGLPRVMLVGEAEMVTVGAGAKTGAGMMGAGVGIGVGVGCVGGGSTIGAAATLTDAEFVAVVPAEFLQVAVYVAVPAAVGVTDCVPLVAVEVRPEPDTAQLAVFVEDQVILVELPRARLVGDAEIVTVGAAGGGVDAVVAITVAELVALTPAEFLQVKVKVSLPNARAPTGILPLVPGLAIVEPSEAASEHDTAFVEDQVSVVALPRTMVVGFTETETVGAVGVEPEPEPEAGEMVTVAEEGELFPPAPVHTRV
jgi:hypothetical protein